MSNPVLETLKLPVKENGVITPTVFDIPQGTVTEEMLNEAEGTKADAIVRTASGDIASYDDGGDLPMKSLKVNIVPKQSGSGDPSPDNVRPISGTDTVEITRTGKNILPPFTGGISGLVTIQSDGSIVINGTASSDTYIQRAMPIKAGTQITISAHNAQANSGVRLRLLGNSGAYDIGPYLTAADATGTYILAQDAQDFRLTIPAGTYNNFVIKAQIELGSIATDYVPYEGETKSITLPQTVYGGTLDVVSGKLTFTHVGLTLSNILEFTGWHDEPSDINWADKNISPLGKNSSSAGPNGTLYCNKYLPKAQFVEGNCYITSEGGKIVFAVGEITRDEFIETLSTPIQVVYELASPTEIDLTPTEVKSLLGDNNVWSDSGTVEVEYRADTSLVINKILEALD